MAFLFTACAGLRLARFNVSPGRYENRFQGMPSPAAAGMVASTQWFVSFLREHQISVSFPEATVAVGTATLGLLMVSSIPFLSFKQVDLRHPFGTIVLSVVVLAVVIQEPKVSFFAIGLAYSLSGPIEWAWRRLSHRPLAEAAAAGPPGAGE
jgi:CDP-diacylglycerol--serine O-phosphatidyltransferase